MILEFCPEPKSFIEIMEHIGLKDRVSFKRLYIQRMLDEGLLKMTNPDNPTQPESDVCYSKIVAAMFIHSNNLFSEKCGIIVIL